MSFTKDLELFATKTNKVMYEVVITVTMKLNSLVIKRTPVDTGRARGGWIASLKSPSFTSGGSDMTGNSTLTAANKMAKLSPGSIYYLVNSVNYINVLEYGGYPKTESEKTTGGYSRLAPSGMVRVSMTEIKAEIKKIARGANVSR